MSDITVGKTFGYLKVLCNPFKIGDGQFVRCRCSNCEIAVTANIKPFKVGDYTCPACGVWAGHYNVTTPESSYAPINQNMPLATPWHIKGADGSNYFSKREFASALGISMYQAGKVVDGFVWDGVEYRKVR